MHQCKHTLCWKDYKERAGRLFVKSYAQLLWGQPVTERSDMPTFGVIEAKDCIIVTN